MHTYIAMLRKDPGASYGVDFPDFPGCITGGDTLEDVRAMAVEALTFHIEGMLEDGDPIPTPSSLESILEDPDHRDATPILVAVPDHLFEQPRRRAVGG